MRAFIALVFVYDMDKRDGLSRLATALLTTLAALTTSATLIALVAALTTLVTALAALIAALVSTGCFAAFATNFGHVFTIFADCFAAFTPGFTGFFAVKFMSCSLLMGGTTTFASNLTLLFIIHGCKATITLLIVVIVAIAVVCHFLSPCR
jgi:hypothetical protein